MYEIRNLPSKHQGKQLLQLNRRLNINHHGGEYASEVETNFWIFTLRKVLRSIKKHCVQSRKLCSNFHAPIMDWFRERIEKMVFPFTYVTSGFFGAIVLKYKSKNLRMWICVSIDTIVAGRVHLSTVCSKNGRNVVGEQKIYRIFLQNVVKYCITGLRH